MAQAAKKLRKVEEQHQSQLELIPTNNHNPFWQSSLFNEVYLLNDVPMKFKEMWEFDEAGPFYEFCNQFRNLCEEIKDADLDSWSERKTINNLIKPILRMLGYTGTATQEPWAEDEPFTVKENGELKTYKPDLIIVNDPKELKYIEREKGDKKLDEARASVIVPIEAKYWGRIDELRNENSEDLKRSDKRDQIDATRALDFDEQCLKYMEILNKEFGILTDGKTWRLFNKDLSSDSYRRNYQFNLGHLIRHVNAGLDRSGRDYEVFIENAKYFFHFFSKSAFLSESGDRRFLDDLLEYSKKYASRIEEDLKGRFVKAMSFACNGFVQSAEDRGKVIDLSVIRNVAESHLFNILFIKHCESRNILPLKQSPEYRKISISNTIDKLEHFNPEKEEDNLNLPVLRRMFSKDFSYDPNGFELYERLLKLTKIVQDGASSKFDSFEVKGFKESIFSSEEWAFVKEHRIRNSEMVSIYFELGYCESDIPGKRYQQIPYNFFSPRQLGSIYESFLEFRLERAKEDMAFIKKQWVPANLSSQKVKAMNIPKVRKGKVFFSPDNKDRKVTGSYYTPDAVVRFIVRETLVPMVIGKTAKEIAATTICDPAMGSGHFLSAALNFLARTYLRVLADEINDDLDISLIDAKQLILHNCIYGVDVNPRAVKLAKMSLWLESAHQGKKLENLDDQLKCFDSLNLRMWDKHFGRTFSSIIANPPYKIEYNQTYNDYLKSEYLSFGQAQNYYTCFLEQSIKHLVDERSGTIGFIVPSSYITGEYYEPLRKILNESPKSVYISDLGDRQVFEDANVYTSIIIMRNEPKAEKAISLRRIPSDLPFEKLDSIPFATPKSDPKNGWSQVSELDGLFDGLPKLGDYCEVKDIGFNYWSEGRGKKRGDSIGSRVLYEGKQQSTRDLPYLKGRDFDKYTVKQPTRYLKHNWENLLNKGDTFRFSEKYFKLPVRVAYRQTADRIIATMISKNICNDKTVHCVLPKDNSVSPYFVLAYLNSSYATDLYRSLVNQDGQAFAQVKTVVIKQLPFPVPETGKEKNISEEIESLCQSLVKRNKGASEPELKKIDQLFGRLINSIIGRSTAKAS